MASNSDSNGSYQNDVDASLLPPKVFGNTSYEETDEVKVYKTRWFILFVYCINGVLQNAMWNTWGPIEETARAVYKWDDYVIDLMSAWGSITFCITMVPFAWIMDVKGEYIWYFLIMSGFWIHTNYLLHAKTDRNRCIDIDFDTVVQVR